MRYVDFLSFNLFQVKLFLKLAETLSFTKAAELCGVTQSAMSRNIKSLEDALGIQLFIRSTNKVSLTPAGRSIYSDWKNFYQYMEEAVYKGARIQEGKMDQLQIGMSAAINIMPELHPLLREFKETHPQIELTLSGTDDNQSEKMLNSGEVDIVFQYVAPEASLQGVEKEILTISPMVIYMLKSNPLSQKEDLSIDDLKSQNIVVYSTDAALSHAEFSRSFFEEKHISPRMKTVFHELGDIVTNLQEDDEIALSGRYHPERFNPLYAAREIGEPRYELGILSRQDDSEDSPAKQFFRFISQRKEDMFRTQ